MKGYPRRSGDSHKASASAPAMRSGCGGGRVRGWILLKELGLRTRLGNPGMSRQSSRRSPRPNISWIYEMSDGFLGHWLPPRLGILRDVKPGTFQINR
jgi:hypothetical protein